MKKSLILLTLILPVIFAFRNEDEGESKAGPNYVIVESNSNAKLKMDEAEFEFVFFRDYTFPVTDSIQFSFNDQLKTLHPDSTGKSILRVKPGKFKFQFFLNQNYYEILTDSIEIKSGFRTKMNIYFEDATIKEISFKPVIYCYPEKTKPVEIKLNLNGELGFTYPKYENGWNFTADPDGTIHQNGKEYEYLFWDGNTNLNKSLLSTQEGFLVKKDSLVSFFENKLAAMGLSPREIEDYITFWVPLMQKNELNFVHFVFNEDYNSFAELTVNPKPDKLFRVYMIWGKANADQQVKEQKMESFSRSGFTVVEWGGTEVSEFPFAAR